MFKSGREVYLRVQSFTTSVEQLLEIWFDRGSLKGLR